MSNLKDTDIDDLFRRASDKYPLRTDSANWDRMAAALEKEPPVPPNGPVDTEEKRKKRRFFWLFLLLPLAGAGYYAWHHNGVAGNAPNIVVPTPNIVTTTPATEKNATAAGSATHGTDQATHATDGTTPAAGQTTPAASATDRTTPAKGQNRPATAPATGAPTAMGRQTETGGQATTGGQNATGRQTASVKNHKAHSIVDNNTKEFEETQPDNSLSLTAVNTRQQPGGENSDRLFYDLQRAPIPHDYHLAVDVTAPAAKKDSTAKPKAKVKHFYAGVFGSPDLSTVKMQSVKGVGTTFGLILGYTFNGGHWAIETGAYVDRKKYYTDGEYFNTKEVRLPSNSYLDDVDGTCYMWEIPLNLRYNFNPGAKTAWFATAGFSTYLMSHEKYTYGYNWMGSATVWDSTWNIHKSSQYPFSIINLSAGFEQRLGKIGSLRVEPYVRLPLGGLGTGKLPIMSAGVNIGITRQLW